jgi:hypothetical protein
MIKKKIPLFSAIGSISLLVILTLSVGASSSYTLLDSVDIGDLGSETGHNLNGWGPLEPVTHPGVWGGATPGSSRARTVYYSDLDGDKVCEYGDDPWAELVLNTNGYIAKELILSHLDGSADDSFDIYVDSTYIDHYSGDLNGEDWVTSSYTLPDLIGQINLRIEVSEPGWTYFCYWGQLAIDWVEVWGEPVDATIDIDPDTLNLKSKGKFITAYIELPEGFDVSGTDMSTVFLNGTVLAKPSPTEIGDYDSDGITDLMVKFDRASVQELVDPGENVEIIITGTVSEINFEGSDYITVIDEGKEHTSEDGSSVVE